MQYVCDAPGGATWFRIDSEAEAEAEAALMRHAVDRHFRRCAAAARESYRPPAGAPMFEQEIGLKDHIARVMPVFLTLRADDGRGLATAMLPPLGRAQPVVPIVIVGPANRDPYITHAAAIAALGVHYGLDLPREGCFPYV
jgi:hypothetical protein